MLLQHRDRFAIQRESSCFIPSPSVSPSCVSKLSSSPRATIDPFNFSDPSSVLGFEVEVESSGCDEFKKATFSVGPRENRSSRGVVGAMAELVGLPTKAPLVQSPVLRSANSSERSSLRPVERAGSLLGLCGVSPPRELG
mmetsp:Transcript_75680/g.157736  ORF Transcript_75680/g.157736 Transcript_75680/m.157736 type:complete len:140 (+) Transcript_75680:278-697(+)